MPKYKVVMSVASFTDYNVTLGAPCAEDAEEKAREYVEKFHFDMGCDTGITCTRDRYTIDVYEIQEITKDDLDEDI